MAAAPWAPYPAAPLNPRPRRALSIFLQEACGLGSDVSPAKTTKRKAEAAPVDEDALAALDVEASWFACCCVLRVASWRLGTPVVCCRAVCSRRRGDSGRGRAAAALLVAGRALLGCIQPHLQGRAAKGHPGHFVYPKPRTEFASAAESICVSGIPPTRLQGRAAKGTLAKLTNDQLKSWLRAKVGWVRRRCSSRRCSNSSGRR